MKTREGKKGNQPPEASYIATTYETYMAAKYRYGHIPGDNLKMEHFFIDLNYYKDIYNYSFRDIINIIIGLLLRGSNKKK